MIDLKQEVKRRKINGVLVKAFAHPATVILAKNAGMDFIFYDCEHGALSPERLHDMMVFGNAEGIPSIVRVPQLARADVSKILDYGARGVMVPMIESGEDAKKLVSWSKYPPIGRRSYSGGANTHYGPSGNHEANMEAMNRSTMTIAQVETVAGVSHIGEIVSTEGIDAVIVGPCDLGISMGNPDHVMDERELELIRRTAQACRDSGKAFGIIGGMELIRYFRNETDIIVTAIDTNLLRDGLKRTAEECRKLTEE